MFATGAPTQYRLRAACADEEIQGFSVNDNGTAVAVSTFWRLHFWSLPSAGVCRCFGGFDVPGCGTAASSDAIVCSAWNTDSTQLIISTTNRRLTFAKLSPCKELDSGKAVLGASPVVKSCFDVRIDHGIILSMRGQDQHIAASTSNGSILLLNWADGRLLRVISSAILGGPARSHSPVVAFDGDRSSTVVAVLSDGTLCGYTSPSAAVGGAAGVTVATLPVAKAAEGAAQVAICTDLGCVATSAGPITTLTLFDFSAASGFARPRHVGQCLESLWCEAVLARNVTRLAWSATGMLCATVDRQGVALVHLSGAVTFTSFSRYGATHLLSHPLLGAGARDAAFATQGSTLLVAEPHSATFEALCLARPSTNPGCPTPCLVEDRSVSVFRWPAPNAEDPSVQTATGWERLTPPAAYLEANSPLRYAAVSPDGQHVAVAGTNGFTLHARRLHRWRIFGSSVQEQNVKCVCEPAWVDNAALAVTVESRATSFLSTAVRLTYTVQIYARHHLDTSSRLAVIDLPGAPHSLSCDRVEGHLYCLAAALEDQSVFLAHIELHADSVHNPKALRVHVHSAAQYRTASSGVTRPGETVISAFPVPNVRHSMYAMIAGAVAFRVRGSSGTMLRIATPTKDHAFTLVHQSPCIACWVVHAAPASVPRGSAIVALHEAGCAVLTMNKSGVWCATQVARADPDAVPVGICAGQLVCASEAARHVMPRLFPSFGVRCTPVSVAQVALLRAYSSDAQSEWTKRQIEASSGHLRVEGSFSSTYDFLIHSVVHEDPPAWETTFDRRGTLARVLGHLRASSEYYDAVVRCIRKGDVAFWRVIFDVVGSPHVFLEECIAHNRIRESVHFVRVLLMERPDDIAWSLEQSLVAARRLLAIVIGRHDFELAYELLRFIALLTSEINLPPISVPPSRGIGAIETMLRAVWIIGSPASPGRVSQGSQSGTGASKNASFVSASTHLLKLHPSVAAGAIRPRMTDEEVADGDAASPPGAKGGLTSPTRSWGMHHVLAGNDLLRDMIDIEAQELLRRGHIIQLCRMFDAFSLDVPNFMTKRFHALADEVNLGRAWRVLHRELGLPLSATRPLPQHGTEAAAAMIGASSRSVVWTDTQEYLAQCPSAVDALKGLERYFSYLGLTEFTLLVDLILLREPSVQAALRASPRLRATVARSLAREPLLDPYAPLLAPAMDVSL
jgi:hypothetical protein